MAGRQHFARTGEKNPWTNRWKVKCLYYTPDTVVEHRELRCTEHLSKQKLCPNTPEPVQKESFTRLATRRGVLSSAPVGGLGAPSNTRVVGLWEMETELPLRRGRQLMALRQSGSVGLLIYLWTAGSRARKHLEATDNDRMTKVHRVETFRKVSWVLIREVFTVYFISAAPENEWVWSERVFGHQVEDHGKKVAKRSQTNLAVGQ